MALLSNFSSSREGKSLIYYSIENVYELERQNPAKSGQSESMRYINELKSGDMISDIYLCKTKQTLKTKAGKSYYSMMLQDKTGTVDAKVWELTPGIEYFEPMDFIKVEGQVTSFQGSLQLNLRRIRRAKEGEYIPAVICRAAAIV